MKSYFKTFMVFSVVAGLFVLQACQKNEELLNPENSSTELKSQKMNTFFGPTVPIGNGVARAWVMQKPNGDPDAVGIDFTAKALERLPDKPATFVLYFPKNKGGAFYTHALIDWNPQGHEPPGVYDLPHFDFHFYIISNEERLQISPSNSTVPVAPQYIPPDYIPIPGVVPEMGSHWVDFLSPEISPDPNDGIFTQTFIWGSNNGEFVFWEPMITMDHLHDLLNLPVTSETFEIRQPDAYAREGWYANNYEIKYSVHPNHYTIALTNLKHHDAE